MLIDNTLRFLSAKVFLPATLLCTISIGSIASNGSGDNLILLPTENDNKKLRETIYVWQHETGEIQEVAQNINELTEE